MWLCGKALWGTQSILYSSLIDQIYKLEKRAFDLQEMVDKIEYILAKLYDTLDDIIHNQAVMDGHAISLCTFLSHQFCLVNQKLNDLVHVNNLTQQCPL